jgi:hypothetical protein
MKISYAITVCNELAEVKDLLDLLLRHKREQDEIVVLLDKPKASYELEDYLFYLSCRGWIVFITDNFDGHFADWKNKLNSFCTGDYIFNIDADEYPSSDLIMILPGILENNPTVEAYLVPRVNTVIGITPDHIAKWGWNVNEAGWINWPDWQVRIYKNTPEIRWKNRVHETLEGIKTYANLPREQGYALQHPKTIERQARQNAYYETL